MNPPEEIKDSMRQEKEPNLISKIESNKGLSETGSQNLFIVPSKTPLENIMSLNAKLPKEYSSNIKHNSGDKAEEIASAEMSFNSSMSLPELEESPFEERKTTHNEIAQTTFGRPNSQIFANHSTVMIAGTKNFKNKIDSIEQNPEEQKKEMSEKASNRNFQGPRTLKTEITNKDRHNTEENIVPAQGDVPVDDTFEVAPILIETGKGASQNMIDPKIESYNTRTRSIKKKPKIDFNKVIRQKLCSWNRADAMGFFAFFCCMLYIVGILIVLIILMSFIFKFRDLNLLSVSHPLEYLAANFKADPILEIQLRKPGENCPGGFQLITLGVWSGTEEGCLCSNNKLKYGSCDASDGGAFCDDISEVDSVSLSIWSGYIWCTKSAIPSLEYIKSSSCPETFIECSSGLCIKESLACPITSFTLTDSSVNVDSVAYGAKF